MDIGGSWVCPVLPNELEVREGTGNVKALAM